MRKSIELKNEKAALTSQYRTILDTAETEKRSTSVDEKEQLRKMDARFEALDQEIQMLERQESREANLATAHGSHRGAIEPQNDANGSNSAPTNIRASKEYHAALCAGLFSGNIGNVSREIQMALQSDSDDGGGYLVASEQFAGRLIEAVDNEVFIRSKATITQVTSAQSLGIPARTGDVDDADWTSEVSTGKEDTGLKFGKRELNPHPLAKRIKVSKKLMRLAPMIESKVIERLGYKFGVAQEKGFLLGTGTEQPLGIFTPSSDGISTARDVSTGLATGFKDADVLIDALYTLKGQYQKNAVWGFHRDALRLIRKLKDNYGQYLWQPGVSGGQPDTILNRPFFMSEYIPNTFTTGQYVGVIGDFSKYEIADSLSIEIQRLIELYAEANQVGFIGRLEADGMPVLEEAFVRLKTA